MRIAIMMGLSLALTGCGLTPKQMEALDGAMCTKIYGATTVVLAGASKGNMVINGDNCSMTSLGAPR